MFAIRLVTKEEKPKEFYLFESKGKDHGLHWTPHYANAQCHHNKDSALIYFNWAYIEQGKSSSYLFKEIKRYVAKGINFEMELCEIKFDVLITAIF